MGKSQTLMFPRRGDVYLVSFDPTQGSEIRKTRPAVIVQNDISNEYSQLTIVAAVTSKFTLPLYPFEVMLNKGEAGLDSESTVLLNQLRSVDKVRLKRRLGKVKPSTLEKINQAIKITLGLIDL
jgi:mRNA interferase MazF